eukprot:6211944-Pleurochrysis_carterae.AAC.7
MRRTRKYAATAQALRPSFPMCRHTHTPLATTQMRRDQACSAKAHLLRHASRQKRKRTASGKYAYTRHTEMRNPNM